MSVQYLTAEKQATGFYFKVLMDDTQKQADGTPKLEFVREYVWAIQPPAGQTEPQYLTNIKAEITNLVNYELAQMQLVPAPIPLTGF